MAKLRGTGIAAVNYPTGMNLGGDPSQALDPRHDERLVRGHAVGDGSRPGAPDGHRRRSPPRRSASPTTRSSIDTADTDTGPHDMGTFASRATHRVGNAVIAAALEARKALLEVAAEELEAAVDDLETDGHGNLMVKGVPARSVKIAEIASLAQFKYGQTIAGPRQLHEAARAPSTPRPARWTPIRPRPTPAPSPRSRSTPRPARSPSSASRARTRSAARSTRRSSRARSSAAPGWACPTPCTRRPRRTTRHPITARRTSAST